MTFLISQVPCSRSDGSAVDGVSGRNDDVTGLNDDVTGLNVDGKGL